MGGEFLNLVWPIIASVFVIMAGSAVVAQEIEQGTIDLWLSVPAGRVSLLSAKLAAIALSICALAVATDLALLAGARLIGEQLTAAGVLALSTYLVLFPLTVGVFAAAVSSVTSSRGHAAGISAGVLVLSYLIWVVSLMGSSWSWLEHLSIFSLFHPADALANSSLNGAHVLTLLVLSALFAAFSLLAFRRRPTV
jgi:ABC-2 type transport system permease protein